MAYAKRDAAPEVVGVTVPAALGVPGGMFCEDAAAALAGLGPGAARFWLSKGATSVVDVVLAALEITGPAAVTIATWTVAPTEAGRLADLLADARITGLRLLTDASLRRRHPAYVALWRSRFGMDAIRVAHVHAKLAVLEGARAVITIVASANLNTARRLESFVVFQGEEPARTITGALDRWFAAPSNLEATKGAITKAFDGWGPPTAARPRGPRRAQVARPVAGLKPACAEDAAYFGSGLLARDVSRVGISYGQKG